MPFERTLRALRTLRTLRTLTVAASTQMFFIVINCKNKRNMKVAASNMNIEIHKPILGVHVIILN